MRSIVSNKLLPAVTWTLIILGGVALTLEFSPFQTGISLFSFHHLYLLFLTAALCGILYLKERNAKTEGSAYQQTVADLRQEVNKTAWRYKCLLEGAGNAIYVFNADNGILEEVNRLGTELLGYTREEMAALHGSELIQPEDLERFASLVLRVKRRGRARSSGVAFRRKDGLIRIVEIDARLIDLDDENVVHVIVRDITHKHQAQKELRRRNLELTILNKILAQANESLQLHTVLEVTLKEAGEFIAADGAVLHLLTEGGQSQHMTAGLNISPELAESMQSLSFTTADHCRLTLDNCCHVGNLDEGFSCCISRLMADAGWSGWAAIPLHSHSRLIGIMHLFSHQKRHPNDEDIAFYTTLGQQIGMVIGQAKLFTELNWKNEELRRSYSLLEKSSHQLELSQSKLRRNLEVVELANQELERLSRMKTQFLGMISHEFRTPLTSILGSSDLLRSSDSQMSNSERMRLLDMIFRGGSKLNDIVDDLLKVARLESKSVRFNRVSIQLQSVMDTMYEHLLPVLEKRQQTLIIENMHELPSLLADREFLADIFSELLRNAIKFTPDGGEIRVSAKVIDSYDLKPKRTILDRFNPNFYEQMGTNQYMLVEVCDNGIGIDSAEHRHIFESFYELGDICNHYTSKYKFQGKGAGLGLAIVKGMVEAHGGMVWVESFSDEPLQQGSSFSLLFPIGELSPQKNSFDVMKSSATGTSMTFH